MLWTYEGKMLALCLMKTARCHSCFGRCSCGRVCSSKEGQRGQCKEAAGPFCRHTPVRPPLQPPAPQKGQKHAATLIWPRIRQAAAWAEHREALLVGQGKEECICQRLSWVMIRRAIYCNRSLSQGGGPGRFALRMLRRPPCAGK